MIRIILRWILALFYGFAGYMHIAAPGPFLTIMPSPIPFPEAIVFWTGVAEIAGAIGLMQPFHKGLRQASGIGLALYALCVWPANINHMMMDWTAEGGPLNLAYHIPRMIAQPVIIAWALWAGEAFPFARKEPQND